MTVSLCIASRGRPELLVQAVWDALDKTERSDTKIVVALDSDDPKGSPHGMPEDPRIIISIGEREDSLGAKYNRCASIAPADLYVLWSDDIKFKEHGWDEQLFKAEQSFQDNIGVVYFGSLPNVFQPGMAVTHKFMEAVGFFCPPYFPYWWHDTWIDEVGSLSGRIIHAYINVAVLQDLKGKSRGVREIEFWAKFFDETRQMRVDAALKIISQSTDHDWRKQQLKDQMSNVIKALEYRNSALRDPLHAKRLESYYSFDAPADERYLRIKAQAKMILGG